MSFSLTETAGVKRIRVSYINSRLLFNVCNVIREPFYEHSKVEDSKHTLEMYNKKRRIAEPSKNCLVVVDQTLPCTELDRLLADTCALPRSFDKEFLINIQCASFYQENDGLINYFFQCCSSISLI